MAKILVTLYIGRDIEEVFRVVSDHETFLSQGRGMRTRVVTPGKSERNGLGCIREVLVGTHIRYLEEITEWTRPISFEYTIREASMPIRHYGSRIEFAVRGAGTDVSWTSHYDIPVPLVGWALGAYMKRRLAASFTQLLKNANTSLTSA